MEPDVEYWGYILQDLFRLGATNLRVCRRIKLHTHYQPKIQKFIDKIYKRPCPLPNRNLREL